MKAAVGARHRAAAAACRTTTAASASGGAASRRGPTSASTSRTRLRARRRRASTSRSRDARRASKAYLRADRVAASRGLQPRRAPRAHRLRALRARAHGRPRRGACAQAHRGGGRLEKLSLEAVGWLLPVLSGDAALGASRSRPSAATSTTASTRPPARRTSPTSYGDGDYLLLHSDRRADGVILEALIGDQPRERPDPEDRARPARRTASAGAGGTRRRTPSCCSRSTATSAPTRR